MKITIFAHSSEAEELGRLASALALKEGTPLECKLYDSYDDFISGFSQDTCDAVIVARRGADGMESARNARLIHPETPLIWLSDDRGFGIESFRIGCVFFSAETITEKVLSAALKRCRIR